MKVDLVINRPISLESKEWLDKCSAILTEKFKNISEEESLKRFMIWGYCAVMVPEEGDAVYVDLVEVKH